MSDRADILGVGVSAVDLRMAVDIIGNWIQLRARQYVCVTGVHGVMESHRNAELRQVHNAAGMVTPDGMPMVWLLRLAGFPHVSRVYGPDLMSAVLQSGVTRGTRHFLYGSTAETLTQLRHNLLSRFAGAQVVGVHSPPFRAAGTDEDDAVCRMINDSGADIIWVGLSTPKQEIWMARHRARLWAPVMIGVGAAFDIHAGMVRQAPRFVQRSGLEWLFRLVQEPRRLMWRYLRNNPAFVFLIMRQKIGF